MFLRERISDGSKYLSDRSTLKGHAKNVILPNDETELREGIRYSSKGNTKVTVSGSRMCCQGGAVPCGGDVMSMERLNGVIGAGKDEKGTFLRVLPFTSVSLFNNSIKSGRVQSLDGSSVDLDGLMFPVKAELENTVGGCIAVNRSDIRPYVRRLRVVFSDSTFMSMERGEYVADGRRMSFPAGRNFFAFDIPSYDSVDGSGPKISENMDLLDLFIGSEGIFGIIIEADIYLSGSVSDSPCQESGKMNNTVIKDRYGQGAVDDLRRIKAILDPNYILNIGNLV
jgi:D-lactate dehydrogenase (cytochrome)